MLLRQSHLSGRVQHVPDNLNSVPTSHLELHYPTMGFKWPSDPGIRGDSCTGVWPVWYEQNHLILT